MRTKAITITKKIMKLFVFDEYTTGVLFITTHTSEKLKYKKGGVSPRFILWARQSGARHCKGGTLHCGELW